METQGGMYRHDTARVAGLIGNGISRQVIRRWHHKERIDGAIQADKNAKVWLNDQGVLQVWALWAEFKDLDFEKDMPNGVRKIRDKLEARGAMPAATAAPVGNGFAVTLILPPGTNLQVIQQG